MSNKLLFQPYTQIIPDYRYDEILEWENRRKGIKPKEEKVTPLQVCVPIPVVPGKGHTHDEKTSADTAQQQKTNGNEGNDQTKSGGIVSSSVMKINRLLLFLLVNVTLFY